MVMEVEAWEDYNAIQPAFAHTQENYHIHMPDEFHVGIVQ